MDISSTASCSFTDYRTTAPRTIAKRTNSTTRASCASSSIIELPARRTRRGDGKHFLFPRNSSLFLLWMILILMTLSMTEAIQYTPEERRIVRDLFLKKFGLEELAERIPDLAHRPAASDATSLPDYVWDLYASVEAKEHDTIRHYFPTNVVRPLTGNAFQRRISYNLSASGRHPDTEHVYRAELRIPTPAANNVQIKVHLYEVHPIPDGNNGTIRDVMRLIESQRIPDTTSSSSLSSSSSSTSSSSSSSMETRWRSRRRRIWLDFDVSETIQRRSGNLAEKVGDFNS